MTYDEAVKIVDRGGRICREIDWVPVKAGFSWGPWIDRKHTWSQEDLERGKERDRLWSIENQLPPTEPTGPLKRCYNTLCEVVFMDEAFEESLRESVDWMDVTDQFQHGYPKGMLEYNNRCDAESKKRRQAQLETGVERT